MWLNDFLPNELERTRIWNFIFPEHLEHFTCVT